MGNLLVVISVVTVGMHLGSTVAARAQDLLAYPVEEFNGVSYDLQLSYDSFGMPTYYHADMLTPVCEDDVCKPVYITLYWDLLGNYLRYSIPVQHPLTKMDHEEFDQLEYEKLDRILADRTSLLKDYEVDELVESTTSTKSGDIDAVTGATAKSLQAVVIPGALYTCYTLWHIVHGRATDTIAKITDSIINTQLLSHFIKSGNHHYQYYALDSVIDSNGNVESDHEQQVIELITDSNVFLATAVLARLSPSLFFVDERQHWLWDAFLSGSYRLKLAILEKFHQLPLTNDIRWVLQRKKHEFNEDIERRIENLLKKEI